MAKYENLGGQHEQDGMLYDKGDIIDVTLPLDKLFLNKFRKLHPDELSTKKGSKTKVEQIVEEVAKDNLGASEDLGLEKLYGQDITEQFENCADLGCSVYAKLNPEKPNRKLYTVVGNDDEEIWNEEPLNSKNKVRRFLVDIAEADEE